MRLRSFPGFPSHLTLARVAPPYVALLCLTLLLSTSALAQQSAVPAPVAGSVAIPAAPAPPQPAPENEIKVECLPASRASELIDKHGCVGGKVFRVTSAKSGTHISLCQPQTECSFHVFIRADDRETVGDLSYLHGKLIAVVGDVTRYRGHPEVIVKDRRQIRVLAADPPKQFDADQSKPATGGQSPYGSKRGRAW